MMLKIIITRFLFTILMILSISVSSFSQTTYDIDSYDGQIVTTCSGFFTDTRPGESDYYDNENYSVTFCSGSPGESLRFIVNPDESTFGGGYQIAGPGDILTAYDGIGTSGTVLGTYSSGDDPGASSFIIQGLSECITFVWVSDSDGDADGWKMQIECVPIGCGSNPVPADNFADAPYVCNLNGFCASTTGYTEDEPFNFVGGGDCDVIFGGTIQNNSWIVFEASGTNISFDIDVIGCYGAFGYDNTPSVNDFGIQAAIIAYDGVSTLTRISDCSLSDGQQLSMTLTNLSPLTVGETYYLVVDGSAGSDCDYKINVSGDVATVDAGPDQVICPGDDLDLTASGPSGATYTWNALDATVVNDIGQSQTYTPTVETIYVVEITSGLCANSIDTVKASMCSLLPIELKDFKAQCETDHNLLHWETYSELDNDYFVIERAYSDFNFQRIATIPGQINTSSITEYNYVDPILNKEITYYRLSQVDIDGSQTHLKTITINQGCLIGSMKTLQPFYNQTSNSISIQYNQSDDTEIRYYLVDVTGRIAYQNEQLLQSGKNELPINEISEAIYFLIVDSPAGINKYKVIISK